MIVDDSEEKCLLILKNIIHNLPILPYTNKYQYAWILNLKNVWS